jgi:hypothetical protein
MNKAQRKFLKGLSESIDRVYISQLGRKMTYEATQKTNISHEDMSLVNKKFDDDKEYTFDMPIFYEVNHFRRLKREFIKHGVNGVYYYLDNLGFEPDEEKLKEVLS